MRESIPHNALHARFEGKRNKGRPRLRWIDNINEDITPLGLTLRATMDLKVTEDNGGHLFVPIAAKWLASGTDEDDDSFDISLFHLPSNLNILQIPVVDQCFFSILE